MIEDHGDYVIEAVEAASEREGGGTIHSLTRLSIKEEVQNGWHLQIIERLSDSNTFWSRRRNEHCN